MKRLFLLLTCLACCAGACAAQGADEPARGSPPGLVVVKLKWERQLELPHERERPGYDASRTASDPDALNDPGGLAAARGGADGRPPFVYAYTAEVRNDDARRIDGLIWEYVVGDPEGKRELGRRRFYSLEKIASGASKKLRVRSRQPPTLVVTAAQLGKDKGRAPAYAERVEFRCVMYADGTWWRGASVEESECLDMKDKKKMREKMGAQGMQ